MELKETMTLPNVKSGSIIKIKDRYYVVYKAADGPHTITSIYKLHKTFGLSKEKLNEEERKGS